MEKKGCAGYKLAGVASGLKKNSDLDLGLIYSEVPASVAAIFTRNKIQAAPVQLDKNRVSSGACQAIIVNSGNANCCTGDQGMQAAIQMAKTAADGLEDERAKQGVAGLLAHLWFFLRLARCSKNRRRGQPMSKLLAKIGGFHWKDQHIFHYTAGKAIEDVTRPRQEPVATEKKVAADPFRKFPGGGKKVRSMLV